jgi:hypothetical protein
MSNSTSIYTGYWVNHSHAPIIGATITLTTQNAFFLSAFLATYIAIAGGHFWSIIAFSAHQLSAGDFHHAKVILRSLVSPWATTWQITSAIRRLRERDQNVSIWHSLIPRSLAIVTAVGFIAAGIMSGKVADAAGDEILIQGSGNCGYWHYPMTAASLGFAAAWRATMLAASIASATYARACYPGGPDPLSTNRPQQCGSAYINPHLDWKQNANASCPFALGTCSVGDTGAFEMDTGLIVSGSNLGINAIANERISFRKVVTCAPIETKSFV